MDQDNARYGLRLAEIHDPADGFRRASVNKLTHERELIILCPECGRHAFQYSPTTGGFHCWHCHIHGKLADVGEQRDVTRKPLTAEERMARAYASEKEGEVPIHVEDYVALSDFEQRAIEDLYVGTDEELAADTTLSDELRKAQQHARRYLSHIGLSLDTARHAQVGVASRYITTKEDKERNEKGADRYCIAYRNYVDGYLTNVKYRCISVKTTVTAIFGKNYTQHKFEKGFDQQSAFTPCAPYGIDVLNPLHGVRHQQLYICEGEKDCLMLRQLGYGPAISVASGANTDLRRSFEAFLPWMTTLQRIYVVGDQDEKGRQLARKLVDFFDAQEVYIAQWDQREYGKDISDVVLAHGIGKAKELIGAAALCQPDDVQEYSSAQDVELVTDHAKGSIDRSFDLHMGPVTNEHLRLFDPGGLIIVTGVPGSGKSDWLNYFVARQMAAYGDHVCFCSFEVPDKHRHLGQLAQTWLGATPTSALSREELRPFVEAVIGHVTNLELRRAAPTYQRVLHKAESVLKRHPQMRYLIIDPYLYLSMTTGNGITETEAIKRMLTDVQNWAQQHHVWVVIVAHPRKMLTREGTEEFEEINFYTMSGSAHWANVGDIVVSLRRVVRGGVAYTEIDVLKSRFQEYCRPGKFYARRHPISRRYAERATAEECVKALPTDDDTPWPLTPQFTHS